MESEIIELEKSKLYFSTNSTFVFHAKQKYPQRKIVSPYDVTVKQWWQFSYENQACRSVGTH